MVLWSHRPIGMRRSVTKNVAMGAAHETLTLGPAHPGTTSYVERAAGVSVVGAATLTDRPVRVLITRAPALGSAVMCGKGARVSSSMLALYGVKAVR
ncbi:hypothetical protein V492_08363 [Pseudogymnoascus sp. VKM F-4246]|nr:hypothetical protein V492_08363 [Pseudogymnoascus sp. VKM F-4246]